MKACSLYSTHWVAKATCLLVCNGKPLLIKEHNQRAYSYLELRCRKPAGRMGKDPEVLVHDSQHMSLLSSPLPPPSLWADHPQNLCHTS